MQSKMLIKESAEQIPLRIHTGSGGKRTERMTRIMSDMHSQQQQHILKRFFFFLFAQRVKL